MKPPARKLWTLALCLLCISSSSQAQIDERSVSAAYNPNVEGVSDQRIDAASQFRPPRFESLGDAILFYEQLALSERWQPIAAGPLLRRGDRHPQVADLRRQLVLLGDLPESALQAETPQHFDEALEAAFMAFQARHSLKVDGILGPSSRRELNVPPWQRMDQLALNLHRQNQLRIDASRPYLLVNLPEYRLRLYQQQRLLLDMKAVIGTDERQTPVFSAAVSRMVVNPDWNVPKSIAQKDILPRWQHDPGYLKEKGLRVLSGWQTPAVEVPYEQVDLSKMYRGTEYLRLWKPPGHNNPLGQVKFQLTAGNSIYLHDTRERHLFAVQKRTFSSGCIRLEQPRALAQWLVMLSNEWSPQRLASLFEAADMVKVRLYKPIPVHVTYWTSWLDHQGRLRFSQDPYQRDHQDFARLQHATSGGPADIGLN